MANLGSHQKLTRVCSSPFGTGADGALSISSSAEYSTIIKSCSGSATSTTLTADTDASPFSAGDIILLHQSRGTGVGQWEVNKIASVGTDQYTLSEALNYTYTDSGSSQAQVLKIPQYTNVTVSEVWSDTTTWNGDTGGIMVFAATGTFTLTTVLYHLYNGFAGGAIDANAPASSGEGSVGAAADQSSANGSGGGGGEIHDYSRNAGGGGGNASDGIDANPIGGYGGDATGTADLTNCTFGGGGGAGCCTNWSESTRPGSGGTGGGIIMMFCNNIVTDSALGIACFGADGGDASSGGSGYRAGGGGGGAGGSILAVCKTATIGTDMWATSGGAGGTSLPTNPGDAGEGSVGRIAVHHSGTVTGTTSPSFEDITDSSLVDVVNSLLLESSYTELLNENGTAGIGLES